jgi:hypothetical protein
MKYALGAFATNTGDDSHRRFGATQGTKRDKQNIQSSRHALMSVYFSFSN